MFSQSKLIHDQSNVTSESTEFEVLINAIIEKANESLVDTLAAIEEEVAGYHLFAASPHHGPDLHDPHMQPRFRETLLSAPKRLEEMKEKGRETLEWLNEIKLANTLTPNQREKVIQIKDGFIRSDGTLSELTLLFNKLLKITDNELQNFQRSLYAEPSSPVRTFFTKLSPDTIKANDDINLLIDTLIAKIKEVMKQTFKTLEEDVEDYVSYASSKKHGVKLSDPHMHDLLRNRLLFAASRNDEKRAEVSKVISILEQLKITHELTEENKKILTTFRNQFISMDGGISRTAMLFDRVIEIVFSHRASKNEVLK